MATINQRVLLNLISQELNKKGYATRFLPNDTTNQLVATFKHNGYVQEDNKLTRGNTTITLRQGIAGIRLYFRKS